MYPRGDPRGVPCGERGKSSWPGVHLQCGSVARKSSPCQVNVGFINLSDSVVIPSIVCFYIGSPRLFFSSPAPDSRAVRVQGFQQQLGKGCSKDGEKHEAQSGHQLTAGRETLRYIYGAGQRRQGETEHYRQKQSEQVDKSSVAPHCELLVSQ